MHHGLYHRREAIEFEARIETPPALRQLTLCLLGEHVQMSVVGERFVGVAHIADVASVHHLLPTLHACVAVTEQKLGEPRGGVGTHKRLSVGLEMPLAVTHRDATAHVHHVHQNIFDGELSESRTCPLHVIALSTCSPRKHIETKIVRERLLPVDDVPHIPKCQKKTTLLYAHLTTAVVKVATEPIHTITANEAITIGTKMILAVT
mmetsp:Transcript_49225/g.123752  ORF Transcript_49225/g.123752 Transcript_49225/m.123752 type:complete len:206 (-) Transcript_49225:344-961(-)